MPYSCPARRGHLCRTTSDSYPQTEGVEVRDLKHGRYRVTGRSTLVGETSKSVDFTCEVAPDAADKLRGFKVTLLEVTPVG